MSEEKIRPPKKYYKSSEQVNVRTTTTTNNNFTTTDNNKMSAVCAGHIFFNVPIRTRKIAWPLAQLFMVTSLSRQFRFIIDNYFILQNSPAWPSRHVQVNERLSKVSCVLGPKGNVIRRLCLPTLAGWSSGSGFRRTCSQ